MLTFSEVKRAEPGEEGKVSAKDLAKKAAKKPGEGPWMRAVSYNVGQGPGQEGSYEAG